MTASRHDEDGSLERYEYRESLVHSDEPLAQVQRAVLERGDRSASVEVCLAKSRFPGIREALARSSEVSADALARSSELSADALALLARDENREVKCVVAIDGLVAPSASHFGMNAVSSASVVVGDFVPPHAR